MENYKKKYEEALKKAKEVYNHKDATDGGKLILESMFPELKESKEESIRKSIIELVKQSSHILNPMNQKSMIGWLEKQAEHNPIDKVEPKFKVGDKITEKDFDECYDGIIKEIKNGKYFFENGDCFDIKEQDLWQLIEQKPTWSEEDDYTIERLFCLLDNEQDNYPQLSCNFQEIEEIKNWLQSLKERIKGE